MDKEEEDYKQWKKHAKKNFIEKKNINNDWRMLGIYLIRKQLIISYERKNELILLALNVLVNKRNA